MRTTISKLKSMSNSSVRFQVLTAASMMFRVFFWDIFTRQYIPEDNSEDLILLLSVIFVQWSDFLT
jgi:hypothetical protein